MRQLAFEIYNDSVLTGAIQAIKEEPAEHSSFLVCHLFCGLGSGDDCLKVADKLAEELPERAVIAGITSNAEFLDGRMTDQVLLLSVLFFDDSEAELLYEDDIENNPDQFGKNIYDRAKASNDVKAIELLLSSHGTQVLDIFKRLEKCDRRIHIFGCMPYGHDLAHDPLFVLVPRARHQHGSCKQQNCQPSHHQTAGIISNLNRASQLELIQPRRPRE